MDHSDVSELAEELAQVTCGHLPWSDQRVIALELGVGEGDLALDDMVRGAPTGRVRCPATSSRGCTSGWTGMTPQPVPTRLSCAAMSTSCVAPNSGALHLHVRSVASTNWDVSRRTGAPTYSRS